MDHVESDYQRNSETAFFDGRMLYAVDFVKPLEIEYCAYFAGGHTFLHRTQFGTSGLYVASVLKVQLSYLFFDSHLRHKAVDEMIHLFGFGQVGPVCRQSGGDGQHSGQ